MKWFFFLQIFFFTSYLYSFSLKKKKRARIFIMKSYSTLFCASIQHELTRVCAKMRLKSSFLFSSFLSRNVDVAQPAREIILTVRNPKFIHVFKQIGRIKRAKYEPRDLLRNFLSLCRIAELRFFLLIL